MVFHAKQNQEQPAVEKKTPLLRKDYPQVYKEWQQIVTQKMSHLSKPQAVVLALWSFGIAVTHCCGLSSVTVFIADLLGQPENNVRERLRQWYKEGGCRGGRKRADVDVKGSFIPLLRWILSWWGSDDKSLVLAADASTLGQRFTVLLIAVVYRGCGIPVAWKIVGATDKGSWKPHWLELFAQIEGGIPADWKVIVTTDRGLYAKWMYQAIQKCHWHPFMRINSGGLYQPAPDAPNGEWLPLSQILTLVGQNIAREVKCFKSDSLSCTLLGRWDHGYTDPWLIVTDLPPQEATSYWYGMRNWIECLFKDLKRGGLGWHQTKMTDPERAERLWLAIAVATVLLVSVGGHADAQLSANRRSRWQSPDSDGDDPTDDSTDDPSISVAVDDSDRSTVTHPDRPKPSPTVNPSRSIYSFDANPIHQASHFCAARNTFSAPRWLSCFRRGYLKLLAALIRGDILPTGRFIPDYSLNTA